uniref:Integrase, catalytic region, zinc finger, CCHC-type, peptidase aspartic, catalytic n=1 Tax=Tanacetum cinerariifolium TaxID=118510 RepID=A0A6L2LDH1_TANCI|nr:integrase, catalytic region, zinc finger, CCHC-type, peptidase aspartic, catalytic [Tanacetum cinerariifolium]
MFQDIDDVLDEDADIEMIVKDRGNSEKGGSTPETVSTARPDISAARQEVSTAKPKTPSTTTTLFDDEDVTIADTLKSLKMDQDQIERDAEVALKIQEDLNKEAKAERERQKEASKAALAEMYDEVQAQIDVDHELAVRLTLEEQEKYTAEERFTHAQLKRSEDDEKRIGSRKKRAAGVPDDNKAIYYETLDVKSPIVDCESQVLGTNKASDVHVYKLTRIDGSYRRFSTFSRMLEVLDREDVLDLDKIIMEWFPANDPEVSMNMFIEKRYPLTKEIHEKMLSSRLEAATKKHQDDHAQHAIWVNVKMFLEGSKLTKDDLESQLHDEFEHFHQNKGDTIHDCYVWFTKLLNDMQNIKMTMPSMQLNSKFVNNMLPEWGRFMTAEKLNRGLKELNYDKLNQAIVQDDKVVVQSVQGRQKKGQGNNPRDAGVAGNGGVQNQVGNANPGQARQIKCYNCNDKMLMMQAQENGVVLDEEQLMFLAGGHDTAIDEDVESHRFKIWHLMWIMCFKLMNVMHLILMLMRLCCLILMTSFDYRLNPLYSIKECSSCRALYTTDYCCSDGSLGDKIICDLDKTPDLSQQPPHNYPECRNPVDGIFCHQCTCELCGNGAHYCYNCSPKVLIVPNPEPFNNQTVKELPPTVPSFDPTCYFEDGNSFTYDSTSNLVHDSPNVFDPPLQLPFYFCGNDARYGHYCTPQIDSLFDDFADELTLLKSIPSGINETDCDPEEETHFIKRLLYDNSSPRPLEEFVFENSDTAIDSLMEEIDLSFTPDDPMPSGVEEDCYESERDILILEELLRNNSLSFPKNESFHFDIPSSSRPFAKPPDGNSGILNVKVMGDISEHKVPIPRLMSTQPTVVPNQEKSPDLLSHLGHEAFQLSSECPMMIDGKNTPILDVPFFHFYPL